MSKAFTLIQLKQILTGFGHDLIAAFHSHGNLGYCNTKYIGAEVEDGNLSQTFEQTYWQQNRTLKSK
jgi:hypothetical protein